MTSSDGSEERWFGARVYRVWQARNGERRVEESILVIKAGSTEDARRRAWASAQVGDDSFRLASGEEVTIKTVAVDSIFDSRLDELNDGAEVFSQLWQVESGDELVIPLPPMPDTA